MAICTTVQAGVLRRIGVTRNHRGSWAPRAGDEIRRRLGQCEPQRSSRRRKIVMGYCGNQRAKVSIQMRICPLGVLRYQPVQDLTSIGASSLQSCLQTRNHFGRVISWLLQQHAQSLPDGDVALGNSLPKLPYLMSLINYDSWPGPLFGRALQTMQKLCVKASAAGVCSSLDARLQLVGHAQRVGGGLVSICGHPRIVDIKSILYKESH